MYLHLGQNEIVPDHRIIGIFDLDKRSYEKRTREYLTRAEKDGVVLDVSGLDNPMASIVDIQWCYDKASTNVNIVKTIFGGNATAPADIYGATLAHYDTAQWKTYIESYKTKMKG